MTMPCELTQHEVRRVAVAAHCDPRTVRAYLAGAPQSGNMVARVEDALRSTGHASAIRTPAEVSP